MSAGEPSDISVLVRTVGRASLAQALASVHAQDFPGRIEVVLVPAHAGALPALPEPPPQVVHRVVAVQQPLGRAAAANLAMANARSPAWLFLDDDDLIEPQHLRRLWQALGSAPQAPAAHAGVRCVSGEQLVTVYDQDVGWTDLLMANLLPIHAVLFRREIVERHPALRFDEELERFEDWDFWLQLMSRAGAFVRVPGVSAVYRLDPLAGSGHAQQGAGRRQALERLAARTMGRCVPADWAALVEQHAEATARGQHLEQARQALQAQLDTARQVIERAERRLDDEHLAANARQAELLAEQQRAQVELSGWRDQVRVLRSELEKTQSELGDTQQELLRLHGEMRLRLEDLASLRAAHERQSVALEGVRQALAGASRELADVRGELAGTRTELSATRAELAIQQTERSAAQAELSVVQADLANHRREVALLSALRLEHLAAIDRFAGEIASIKSSTSWRLTAPLRGAGDLLAWLRSGRLLTLWRNAWVSVRAEHRRFGVAGLLRRLPRHLRNGSRHLRMLSRPSVAPAVLSFAPSPPPPAVRMHPEIEGREDVLDVGVSVVIPTFNAGLEFEWLLRKLRAQRGLREVEVVVVDSGSTDETVDRARAQGARVVQITQAEFTHSHSRNLGAQAARGDYVLFMVQDAFPVGDLWIRAMVEYLRDHAAQGVVAASCAEYPRSDSDIMYECAIATHYRFLGCHETDRIGSFTGEDHMALRSMGQLSDVACLIPRELFQRYTYRGDYAEDLDLGIRLIRDGHKVAMLSTVRVVHSHNRPAFYYLKRSFVDVTFLVALFEDFIVPRCASIVGLLDGAAAVSQLLAAELPAWDAQAHAPSLAQAMESLMARLRAGEVKVVRPCPIGDARFDAFLADLHGRVHGVRDGQAQREARAFVDNFVARVDHLSAYAASVHGAADAAILSEMAQALRKTFAATLGASLAFLYLDRRQAAGDDPERVLTDGLHGQLKAGV